jgi:mannose-6-phosphate isomerase-like protein (cupin superfamily)
MVSQKKSILKTSYSNINPYTTRDGSLIRELMHPEVHGNKKQSLAEATVPVGTGTVLHRHDISEEIYHITVGKGRMTLGEHTFEVVVGDTICIPPGTDHRIENTGRTTLKLFCCCAPPYSHNDTDLLK